MQQYCLLEITVSLFLIYLFLIWSLKKNLAEFWIQWCSSLSVSQFSVYWQSWHVAAWGQTQMSLLSQQSDRAKEVPCLRQHHSTISIRASYWLHSLYERLDLAKPLLPYILSSEDRGDSCSAALILEANYLGSHLSPLSWVKREAPA